MEIKVNITKDDFVEFNKHVLFGKRRISWLIIASIGIIIWTYLLNKDSQINFNMIIIEVIVFSTIWYIFYKVSNVLLINRIKKMLDNDGSLLGDRTYYILKDGLKEISENNESLTKWQGIKKVTESEEGIYIFVDKIAAYIVPKRFFDTNEEMNSFINLINSRIENKKY